MKWFSIFSIAGVLVMTMGCGSVTLSSLNTLSESDWPQLGQNPARTFFTPESVSPPLSVVWTHKLNRAPESSMVLKDNVIFLNSLGDDPVALRAKSGKEFGKLKIGRKHSATTALYDMSVIIFRRMQQPSIERYDLESGETIWSVNNGPLFTDPLVVNKRVYAAYLKGKLVCYDFTDGKVIWEYKFPDQLHSTPAYREGTIYCGCNDGNVYAIREGKQLWKTDTGGAIKTNPTVFGDHLFVGSTSSRFYALNIESGTVSWTVTADGGFFQPAAVDDDIVVAGSTDRTVYAFDPATGDSLWSYTAGGVVSTAPVLTPEHVIFGSEDKILSVLDRSTGKKVWSFETEGAIRTHPLVYGGRLYIANYDKKLLCLGPPSESDEEQ